MTSPQYAIIGAYEMVRKAELIAYLSTRSDSCTDTIIVIDGTEVPASPPRVLDLAEIQIISPKRRDLFPKNDKIHWHGGKQRKFRGRQHQRLIFQRTTNK